MSSGKKASPKAKPATATARAKSAPAASDGVASAFAVVGIGASAGGLAAFEAFFSGMPIDHDPGMAFVLVQHLAPDHKSLLTDLIRRCTHMQVFEVEDGMVVAPNCAYVIPPNRDMAFQNGTLHLFEPTAARGHRLPIDYLFSSLARDQRERAIAIVLSGTGSDGTAGIRAIKDEGGMVMAQDAASSEFDGMPRSAIATGLVDFELPPAEMPAQLIAYATHTFGPQGRVAAATTAGAESTLSKVFVLLRAQTGHDFSQYKPNTIRRRIERRMAVHQIANIAGYLRLLQQTPGEADALFHDLLIGVTSFFRDPAAFKLLEEQVIPKLFEHKGAAEPIRVWCAGCSTGEEAYSIAILLHERMESLKQTYKVQVFATDIDSRAIATARSGPYPASIARDVSPERLARFFNVEADGISYRVHKSIRDMLVFSEQDLIKDPPFSKLDLISCRNLLIYMGPELQQKLMPMFHYTLNPRGMLFLGTSESIGEFAHLFATIDHKSKIYQRRAEGHGDAHPSRRHATLPQLPTRHLASPAHEPPARRGKVSLRELTEQALLKLLPVCAALVNAQGDILYLHGRSGEYLEPTAGEASVNNILKMAREGLRRDLTSALREATLGKASSQRSGLRVRSNGHHSVVDLGIAPVTALAEGDPPLFLVQLSIASLRSSVAAPSVVAMDVGIGVPADSAAAHAVEFDGLAATATIAALNEELRANREHLQAANEQLETSNEELKSSNEEMQSVNEELQSTNEELETSKEEMQSINEELATVNSELQTKVADLSRASNDMKNLLASTGIGTVFVDHQLRILRYTPMATRIINLIPSDIGRPVAHTVSNLVGYDQLVVDAQAVLATLVPKEVEVEAKDGSWYTMRIQPYRTFDNVIEGAVLTFVDITETMRARQALRKTNALFRLAVVVRDAFDAITVQDLSGRTLAWNQGATRMYGWSETQALQLNVLERTPAELREQSQLDIARLRRREILVPRQTVRMARDGRLIEVWLTATALVDESDQVYAIATTERLIEGNNPPNPEHDHG